MSKELENIIEDERMQLICDPAEWQNIPEECIYKKGWKNINCAYHSEGKCSYRPGNYAVAVTLVELKKYDDNN